ncbi:MAG: hypothetical protein H7Z13_00135 [Ferruginibacter sp.]|nr:hypothetical protein [Ferruginibacter sp.]
MTKRKENEPDNKAFERLKEFNRQRQEIPGENKTGSPGSPEKNGEPDADCADDPAAENDKKNIKKSPKK